jgi:8-oxo-dGTP pyrophosphatase MutT (NUDIX family)
MTLSNEPIVPHQTVVPPRKAASVLMLRTREKILEVFIQHRATTMDFAAGMVVFPGGRVEQADRIAALEDPPAAAILASHANAWRNTSLAEAGPTHGHFESSVVLAAARREVFEETGCLLEAEQLRPWANWVTPPQQPKRFDTFFYVASPAPGSLPRHQTTEAVSSVWMAVDEVLAAHVRGQLRLMRPTQALLHSIRETGSLEMILAANVPIVPVRPR